VGGVSTARTACRQVRGEGRAAGTSLLHKVGTLQGNTLVAGGAAGARAAADG